ncbi:MAG: restriction endonuclease subunit S [Candidatus Poribacteria bacterium]|nr:restriction endonuclease subunit S [Candidatus Poribacteria bacterium]
MRTLFSNDLPKGWVWTTLQEISEIILGQSPPSSTYNTKGEGLPFYQGKLEFGKLYPKPRKWCTEPKKIAQKGDVFISIRAPVGPTNICPEKSAVGRGLAAIRGLGGIESFFILYLMRTFANEIASKGTGTTFDAITVNQLKTFEIPLPPLAEQHRIVSKLETLFTQLDLAVNNLKKAQVQLQRYRRSILKAAFEGELTREWREGYWEEPEPMEVSEISTLEGLSEPPDGWVWTTLANCADILDSQRVPINAKERETRISGKSESQLYPYYGATGQVGWIDDHLFDEELVLLGEDGAPFLDVLKDTAYLVKGKSWVNNHAHVLRAKTGATSNQFLCHYLNTFDYHGYLTGTTRLKLNQSTMRKIPVLLPSLPEQKQIVSEVETHLSVSDKIEATLDAELKRAERLQQSILKDAFSGKLVPQDPNDEPASTLLEKIRDEKERPQPKRRKKTTKSKTQSSDDYPLLALAGALERNDDLIGDVSPVELRGGKGE